MKNITRETELIGCRIHQTDEDGKTVRTATLVGLPIDDPFLFDVRLDDGKLETWEVMELTAVEITDGEIYAYIPPEEA